MIKLTAALGIGFAIIALAGCSPRGGGIPATGLEALEEGEQFELLSLDPEHVELKRHRTDEISSAIFHNWIVLGRTTIGDSALRKRLIEAFSAGAKERGILVAGCFNPRHAIHVVCEGNVIDFVICFECGHVLVIEGENKSEKQTFSVSESPQSVFNDVLKSAGISLAEELK